MNKYSEMLEKFREAPTEPLRTKLVSLIPEMTIRIEQLEEIIESLTKTSSH
jgi:hypothetical protein